MAVEQRREDLEELHVCGIEHGHLQLHDEGGPLGEILPLHRERGRPDKGIRRDPDHPAEGAEALAITAQPEPVEAAEGAAVSFHVGANRTGAAYQWQWSKDGKTWKNCTSAGSNTDTFSFTMKEVLSGRYYRCVVSADGQTKESEGALITLAQDTEALAITSSMWVRTGAMPPTSGSGARMERPGRTARPQEPRQIPSGSP